MLFYKLSLSPSDRGAFIISQGPKGSSSVELTLKFISFFSPQNLQNAQISPLDGILQILHSLISFSLISGSKSFFFFKYPLTKLNFVPGLFSSSSLSTPFISRVVAPLA
ncbi:108aa long hypothetical protein [Pyrococcus horikoshii OT3]|uniref:Uncharacterized protein n=1 Tax=Pyrococcus horikoshii (strain ATCC 700860 / DSM 12428 / JCM 9974 / NBRC 100139 / OT-3) TaxID=70601 RepID=O58037_PYRHO|nr:108aa long hypothetical protein [Pyrococcus horikoshii OT3]